MLHLHVSNRTEALTAELLVRLDAEQPSPFAAAHVIVPSTAMRRWLTLAIAQHQGVCANVHFDYLANWLWQQLGRLAAAAAPALTAPTLAWRVYRAFGDAAFVAAHPRLAAYLQAADDVMRLELAQRSAALFEQYVTYRPDWLAAWAVGQSIGLPARTAHAADGTGVENARADAQADEAWQAALWRRIADELGLAGTHPGAAVVQALHDATPADLQRAGLPASAHVFALPTVPPLHLQLLLQLAQTVELHLYVLNPCREYWFEVIDRRRLAHLRARAPRQALLQEEGNRLLAGWGRQTQSHIDLLLEHSSGQALEETDDFLPSGDGDGDVNRDVNRNGNGNGSGSGRGTLLAQLQNAVLDLHELAPGSVALAADDRSVEVHVCHSLTRELEVLQDHLLGLFADSAGQPDGAHAGLRPSDVLVVLPDLEAAAPLVDAVFGTAPPARWLPHAISGRARSSVDAPARTLLDLLALCASRCVASSVFALLQQANVARRFGLGDDGLQNIHTWLREAGFRWGLHAAHRAQFGVPAQARHTLADALARLMLGYASPSSSAHSTVLAEPFEGLLPAGDAEGTGAAALGALARFADALQRLHAAVQRAHTPDGWAALLLQALDVFTQPAGDELDDHRALQASIRTLVDTLHAGGMAAEPLPFGVLRTALAHALDDPARGGVATGKITFSSMTSLRNIPFKVICVLGLDDGAFPSANRPPEFDLMALQPRRGDRQRRHDERNLLLDLVLAARRSLYISHTGRSVRDNAPLPPSVLVSELLETLAPATADPRAVDPAAALRAATARLRVEHPLQPFSLAAFAADGDPRLRSFNTELADALRHGLAAGGAADAGAALPLDAHDDRNDDSDSSDSNDSNDSSNDNSDSDSAFDFNDPQRPFFGTPLPAPGPEWRDVRLPQLIEFFRNTSRYLLRRRLGLHLLRDADELLDDEPFLPDLPARSALAQRLLPALLADTGRALAQPQATLALASAGIEMPGGALGQDRLQRELQAMQRFAERVRSACSAPLLPPRPVVLTVDVHGTAWRLHAAFGDLRSSGLVRWRYDALRARDALDAWLSHLVLCAAAPPDVAPSTTWLALDGALQLQPVADAHALLADLLQLYAQGLRAPLPFFAKSAWAFVDGGSSAARKAWLGGPTHGGESQDAAHRLAWRGRGQGSDSVAPGSTSLGTTDLGAMAFGAHFEQLALRVLGPVLQHRSRD